MGRPRKKTEGTDLKTTLLRTFIKLCYWRGTGAITLQELARECGVAFNAVHYHFGGPGNRLIEDAWASIQVDRQKIISETVESLLKKGEKNPLKAFLKAQFAWCDRRKDEASFWLFRLFQASTHASRRSENGPDESMMIKRICQEAVGAGVYQPLGDLNSLSRKITVIITGALTERLTQPGISQEENFSNCWELITGAVNFHKK